MERIRGRRYRRRRFAGPGHVQRERRNAAPQQRLALAVDLLIAFPDVDAAPEDDDRRLRGGVGWQAKPCGSLFVAKGDFDQRARKLRQRKRLGVGLAMRLIGSGAGRIQNVREAREEIPERGFEEATLGLPRPGARLRRFAQSGGARAIGADRLRPARRRGSALASRRPDRFDEKLAVDAKLDEPWQSRRKLGGNAFDGASVARVGCEL